MKINIPYFDGDEVECEYEENGGDAALAAFLKLTADDRNRDSRHVLAYYRDFYKEVGQGQVWMENEIGLPDEVKNIWEHVTPGPVYIEEKNGVWYVAMEAECAWEQEHGLMMVWKNGAQLTKVGGYDGQLTNANANADPGLDQVVYRAMNRDFTTTL